MKYNSISCMANIEQLLQPFNITWQKDICFFTEIILNTEGIGSSLVGLFQTGLERR